MSLDTRSQRRAKGVRELLVRDRHALRPALIPIVACTGVFAFSLVGASVMVEGVFGLA